MDCGFQCPNPPTGGAQPSPSATIAHALPSGAVTAVAGVNSLVNTFISSSTAAPAASSSAPAKPDYVQGACSYHVTQYQKNEGDQNPTENYQVEVTVYDASNPPAVIGTLGKTQAPTGQGVNVTGKMPYPLVVTAEGIDSDPLDFSYNGLNWKSNDTISGGGTKCKTGSKANGYDSGKREMDCGFGC